MNFAISWVLPFSINHDYSVFCFSIRKSKSQSNEGGGREERKKKQKEREERERQIDIDKRDRQAEETETGGRQIFTVLWIQKSLDITKMFVAVCVNSILLPLRWSLQHQPMSFNQLLQKTPGQP